MSDIAYAVAVASLVPHDGSDNNRPYIRNLIKDTETFGQFSDKYIDR